MDIDTSTEFGARVARRLENDQVIWLTTLGPDGTPQPSPVWFLWDGDTALIYSQAMTPKLRNIAQNRRVSLHFNSTASGADIVILTGDASIDRETPAANEVPEFLEKYIQGMRGVGIAADDWAQAYSVPIRVRPTALRGH
jgi:PPOX class probable F420-dependent enzyme